MSQSFLSRKITEAGRGWLGVGQAPARLKRSPAPIGSDLVPRAPTWLHVLPSEAPFSWEFSSHFTGPFKQLTLVRTRVNHLL